MIKLLITSLFAVAAFAAASTSSSPFCVTPKKCPTSASCFCSSYLHIPAKTTTVAPTVTVTKTTTVSSGTATATKTTGTSTYTSTAYNPDYITQTTTVTYSSTPTCTSYTWSFQTGGCTFTGTDPNAPQQKRAATSAPAATKPSCLAPYPSGTALSSACKCLSVSTSTSTITRGKPTTKTTTKTIKKVKTTTTAKVVATATTTFTSAYTETLTSTVVIQPPTVTTYAPQSPGMLVGQYSGMLADFVSGGPDGNELGMQFSQEYGIHADNFFLGYYENTPCVLSNSGGSSPYAFIGATGDMIEFTSEAVPADQLVQCVVEPVRYKIYCKHPQGTTYNQGYVDSDLFWHIPINDSLATANIYLGTIGESSDCFS